MTKYYIKSMADLVSICSVYEPDDFDVTTSWLQNEGNFQEVYCNTTNHCCYIIRGGTIRKLTGNNIVFATCPLGRQSLPGSCTWNRLLETPYCFEFLICCF